MLGCRRCSYNPTSQQPKPCLDSLVYGTWGLEWRQEVPRVLGSRGVMPLHGLSGTRSLRFLPEDRVEALSQLFEGCSMGKVQGLHEMAVWLQARSC